MTFIYQAVRGSQLITGVVKEDNSFKALFAARKESFFRGGSINEIQLSKI